MSEFLPYIRGLRADVEVVEGVLEHTPPREDDDAMISTYLLLRGEGTEEARRKAVCDAITHLPPGRTIVYVVRRKDEERLYLRKKNDKAWQAHLRDTLAECLKK